MSLDNVSIVLVRTSHAGNIGAVARAMANMGFSDLRLVEPVNFPASEATARAVGAVAILESAEVFESLDEAISDAGLVVGATARLRSVSWPTLTPHEAMQEVAKMCKANKVSLVFGKERPLPKTSPDSQIGPTTSAIISETSSILLKL